jgi:2-succinyl-5-enolpyruvyl-6-hydroxy-3-cyclohexene-1-carboxylate synthase
VVFTAAEQEINIKESMIILKTTVLCFFIISPLMQPEILIIIYFNAIGVFGNLRQIKFMYISNYLFSTVHMLSFRFLCALYHSKKGPWSRSSALARDAAASSLLL